jgi:hypothetical protein
MLRDGSPDLTENMDGQGPEQQANDEDGKAEEQIPTRLAKAKFDMPVTPSSGSKLNEHKKHWIDYAKFILELLGFFVLCVYACYTIKIYRANKDAADAAKDAAQTASKGFALTKQITEGTSEAVCFMNATFRDLGANTCSVSFYNLGHVAAKSVRADVELSIRKLPSNVLTGKVQMETFSQDEMIPRAQGTELMYAPGHGDITRAVNFPMLTVYAHNFENRTAAFMVRGMLTYDNGFGTIRNTPYCVEFVYFRAVTPQFSPVPCDGPWGIRQFLKDVKKSETQGQK